jgi:hypothetical protein
MTSSPKEYHPKTNKLLWWAYLHTNGEILVKRYFDRRDFEDANESPFVVRYTSVIEADTREEVLKIATNRLLNGPLLFINRKIV